MPFDGKGKHHLNTQKAMAADRMPPRPAKPASAPKPQSGDGGPGVQDAMPHGADETDMGGDTTRHLTEMQAGMGGKHAHIHQGDDGSVTTHHVGEDGVVQGPHEHPDLEAAHQHLMAAMQEERAEGEGGAPSRGLHPKHNMPMHEHALQGI